MSVTLKDTGFETIEHFYLMNFSVLAKAIALGLAAIEYRTWQYVNSCSAHGIEVDALDACAYLDIPLCEFFAIVAELHYRNLLPENQILGGKDDCV